MLDKKEDSLKEILRKEPDEKEVKKKIVVDSKNQVTLRIPASFYFKAGLKKGQEVTIVLNPNKKRIEKLLKSKPKILAYITK